MALESGHDTGRGVGHGLDGGQAAEPDVLDADVETLTIAEASARLGVAPDAIRKRIRRGSLRAVKVDGTWRVLLDPAEAAAWTQDTGVQAARPAAAWTRPGHGAGPVVTRGVDGVPAAAGTRGVAGSAAVRDDGTVEAYRELVSSLQDQVDFLRRELETRSRELEGRAEEVRRRDLLLDAMAQRLRQLPAPTRPEDYGIVLQAAVAPAAEMGRLKAELEQARQRVAEYEAVTDELERAQAAATEAARRPWWRFWA